MNRSSGVYIASQRERDPQRAGERERIIKRAREGEITNTPVTNVLPYLLEVNSSLLRSIEFSLGALKQHKTNTEKMQWWYIWWCGELTAIWR